MELEELGIAELQAAMTQGEASAREVAEGYLGRIEAIDRSGPTLRSVIEVNPDALEIADALDRERGEQGPRGPLHGVPILIKDNIDSGDRMRTSAGSLALAEHVAADDAFVVAQLRRAGALLLGKTNLSEWANFRSTRSASGWSSRGGQVRNPYALDRSPCGSSAGSGAAAAASLAAGTLGTETDGSIVCPSAVNGIVGIKPTVGLVSRSGIVPISHSQDTSGPMTRSVEDAALLLTAIAGSDPRDPASANADARRVDYRAALDPASLRGARLGVARTFFGKHEGVDAVIEAALTRLSELGAELIDPIDVGDPAEVRPHEFEVLLTEFKADLDRYLAEHPGAGVRSLVEAIAFNRAHADRAMPTFRQELFEMAQAKGGLDGEDYLRARAESLRLTRDEGIDRALREHRLDAIVAPTAGPAWVIDPIVGDRGVAGCSSLAAIAGYPHVTVPAGYLHGLPLGISFFGGAWQEARLLSLAYAFERASGHRRPPGYDAHARI
jgi:amidase